MTGNLPINLNHLLSQRTIEGERIDAMQKELMDIGYSAMRPHYHLLTATYSVEGRTILVLWVPGGETRPYKAKVSLTKGQAEWSYFIRKHSSTVRAKKRRRTRIADPRRGPVYGSPQDPASHAGERISTPNL